MKIRAVAAAALALAVGAGLTGCNFISPQRTQMEYDPSDGVSADLVGVTVQNALILAEGESENANFVFTAVNLTQNDAEVSADVQGNTVEANLPGNPDENYAKVGYGEGGQELITGNFVSGTNIEVTFTSTFTDAEGQTQTVEQTVIVPILGADDPSGVLSEYQTLMPTPVETPEETVIEIEPGETAPPADGGTEFDDNTDDLFQ